MAPREHRRRSSGKASCDLSVASLDCISLLAIGIRLRVFSIGILTHRGMGNSNRCLPLLPYSLSFSLVFRRMNHHFSMIISRPPRQRPVTTTMRRRLRSPQRLPLTSSSTCRYRSLAVHAISTPAVILSLIRHSPIRIRTSRRKAHRSSSKRRSSHSKQLRR